MDNAKLTTAAKNERLAVIVERCLESPAAYQLFDMLASISKLDQEDKLEYMELVKESGVYSDEEIEALGVTLQNWVKENLAPYKYPRFVEFVADLPRNDRGKIDRKSLQQRQMSL